MLSEDTKHKVIENFETKNLREYIAVLSKCKALIGNEGGSTNISKALNIPTFSIYAPHIGGWDWFIDKDKNKSIHSKNYEIDNYENFKPYFFEKELESFIKNNIS